MKNVETKQIESLESPQLAYTSWEELSISNDFMFGKVMQDPEQQKSIKPVICGTGRAYKVFCLMYICNV